MNVAIVTDKAYKEHITGWGHPESPARFTAIDLALRENNLLRCDTEIKPREASVEELALCHSIPYIELVQKEADEIKGLEHATLSTGDVEISSRSFAIAKFAAGAVLTAVDLVSSNSAKRTFCTVRPPGHHASREIGMGFCLFNNIAIGARYAQVKYGIQRIAIIDWDVHHGNGTQDIFYEDPTVFYFSTHQEGIFPWTGYRDEKGSNEAIGTTLNAPIRGGLGARRLVFRAFEQDLIPAMEKFQPELIMISAGFDGHIKDPLGGFDLETEDFALLTQIICDLSDRYCEGKIISVLEGGYNLTALAECAAIHVRALEGV